jgi:hypothetical protein
VSTEDKRETTSVRVYDSTLDEMRTEATRLKNEGAETTYSDLIEKSWEALKRERGSADPDIETYYCHRNNKEWHEQLELILAGEMPQVKKTLRHILDSMLQMANRLQEQWSVKGDPDEGERDMLNEVLAILRKQDGEAVRRELLLTLLGRKGSAVGLKQRPGKTPGKAK